MEPGFFLLIVIEQSFNLIVQSVFFLIQIHYYIIVSLFFLCVPSLSLLKLLS